MSRGSWPTGWWPADRSRTSRSRASARRCCSPTSPASPRYVEQVSASRPNGLEDLARAFDTYFADLVGFVYGHGGDVLAIAGDSFFSYWPVADDGDLPDAVMRAAQAGLAIQAGLGQADGPEPHTFQTRAGVSAGHLRIAFVGGVGGRWELMPTGSPIDDVARAERLAAARHRGDRRAGLEPRRVALRGAPVRRRPGRADGGAPPGRPDAVPVADRPRSAG